MTTLFQAIPLPQWIEGMTGGDPFKVQNPHATRDVTDTTGTMVRKTA